ncbi:X-ray repair cross-complementing protein 6 [Hypsibius exemplaris]|uniref:ATP-dependent DNA helicase 2 subunit 1 n=1 Tax=Hypsibius exemplaris TaxID=2072580 RepID=A0A1W0WBL1_HYPEX|nr:X-ray repair cross-complementing protein 6 [Hypsibius exemplaris]
MLYAKQKASDNFEAGISMSLFALELQNGHFDPTKFWDDVIVAGSADDDDQRVAPMGDWEDLTALITRKDHSRRAMGNLSLILGEGLELSVSVFTLVRTANKPPAVKLWKKTNQQVEKPERMTMDEDSATVLMPTDMQKYMEFAGKKIFFKSEEIQAMKHFGSTGIRVIAFKSLDALKEKHHIRPAQFLYPNEGDIRGSTKLFIALLTKCLEKRVMAVCRYSPRENISPKLVGLVPQEEVLGEQGEQLTPAGFHIIFFPFADDFRGNNPAPKNAPVADEAQIAKARELVKKLKFPYSPEDFPNPALHTHLKNIQALALGEEIKTDEDGHRILNDFTDYTEPQTAGIERKVGKLLKEFISLVYPHGYDPEGAHTKKRVYEKKEPVTKRGPAAASQGTGADDIAQAAEAGNLKKYTLPILKEYCKSHKVKVEGSKKDDYIGAIETHLAGND